MILIALLNVRSLPISACHHLPTDRRTTTTRLHCPFGTRRVEGIILSEFFACRNLSTSNDSYFVTHPQIRIAGMSHSSWCSGKIDKVSILPNLHRIVAGNGRYICSKLLLSHDHPADNDNDLSFMNRLAGKHSISLN